jgi:predicted  nucleic acid-binding Zn ribbon protein
MVRTLQQRRTVADAVNTMAAPVKGDPMVATVARAIAGAARDVAGTGAQLTRHAVWYVRYRVDGNSRAQTKREHSVRAKAQQRR